MNRNAPKSNPAAEVAAKNLETAYKENFDETVLLDEQETLNNAVGVVKKLLETPDRETKNEILNILGHELLDQSKENQEAIIALLNLNIGDRFVIKNIIDPVDFSISPYEVVTDSNIPANREAITIVSERIQSEFQQNIAEFQKITQYVQDINPNGTATLTTAVNPINISTLMQEADVWILYVKSSGQEWKEVSIENENISGSNRVRIAAGDVISFKNPIQQSEIKNESNEEQESSTETISEDYVVINTSENLRDPNSRVRISVAQPGERFKILGEAPSHGKYQYKLVENEAGEQFILCVNDGERVVIQTEKHEKENETVIEDDGFFDNNGVSDVWGLAKNYVDRQYDLHVNDSDFTISNITSEQTEQAVKILTTENEQFQVPLGDECDIPSADYEDRYFCPKVLNLSATDAKFGYRNRGNYDNIDDTHGIVIPLAMPLYSPTENPLADNATVIGVDTKTGDILVGTFKEFKNNPNAKLSLSTKNNIIDIPTDEHGDVLAKRAKGINGKDGYLNPKTIVVENGKKIEGSLNSLFNEEGRDKLGGVQGGNFILKSSNGERTVLFTGTANQLAKVFKEFKGDDPYVSVFNVDNGTYALGLQTRKQAITGSELEAYDRENSSGGNGLYLMMSETEIQNKLSPMQLLEQQNIVGTNGVLKQEIEPSDLLAKSGVENIYVKPQTGPYNYGYVKINNENLNDINFKLKEGDLISFEQPDIIIDPEINEGSTLMTTLNSGLNFVRNGSEMIDLASALYNENPEEVGAINQKILEIEQRSLSLKEGETLPIDDINFMKNIYSLLTVGGLAKQMGVVGEKNNDFYAASQLIDQYINGSGKTLEINSAVYEHSSIVQWSMKEMSTHIENMYENGFIKDGDEGDFTSKELLKKQNFPEGAGKMGQILAGGTLLAEQENQALKNTDHRFTLNAHYEINNGKVKITWRVNSYYDFENKATDVTNIPIPGEKGLKIIIPDRLSYSLAKQGIAKEFAHFSTWKTEQTPAFSQNLLAQQ